MTDQNDMTQYLNAFIEGLTNSGVERAVISPGSRSTPLALLLHRNKKITTFVEVDERSAAFFALGLSKASRKPVALLCTSGTAAANYYPAICEANASSVPLVVLTTDRPHELRQVGAPQAMDQFHLFQSHVKAFFEMAIPEGTKTMLDYAYWQGVRATDLTTQTPKGPVHLNFPLREPLLPNLDVSFDKNRKTEIIAGKKELSSQQIQSLVSSWQEKRGVLVIGGSRTVDEAKQLVGLAEGLNWPIIGDPLTNIATCGMNSQLVMSHADLFIQETEFEHPIEVIVRFGSLPISKNMMLWLKSFTDSTTSIYFIDETSQWHDQLKQAQIAIQTDEQAFVHSVLNKVNRSTSNEWSAQWIAYQNTVDQIIEETSNLSVLNETSASLLVHKKMTSTGQLFVSNSNAIRYVDRFVSNQNTQYQLFGNRGVNGIDGIVSTALGMTAIHPSNQNILLIGDLALYHDMNGLWLAKQYNLPLTIVLLNNNGGGIFSFLSQNQLNEDDFEPIFGTSLNLDFSLVAKLYNAKYTKAESLEHLDELLEKTKTQPIFQLIEVVGDRQENVELYDQVTKRLKMRLRGN